jgi:protein SCO1/2
MRETGVLGVAASALLLLGIWRIAYRPTPDVRPAAPSGGRAVAGEAPEWRGRFPNVPLVTHDGRVIRFYDDLIRGHLVALNFFYIECEGTCPGVTSTLVEVERALRGRLSADLRIVCLTLQPDRDSPDRLKEYAERYGAGPGMVFLTGRPEHLDLVRRAMGFGHPEDPARDLDRKRHAAILRIGNEPEGWWSVCPSLAPPPQVEQAIRSLDRSAERPPRESPLAFPGGVPLEWQGLMDLRARQEWAAVLDRLERLWMSREPMDLKPYQELILSQLVGFLEPTPEGAVAFRTAALAAVADLAKARRRMEYFRGAKPYDGDDPVAVRAYRAAWTSYRRERSEALARLDAALGDGPRAAMLREQSFRWMSVLEDHPEHLSVPQDEKLVPIRKK